MSRSLIAFLQSPPRSVEVLPTDSSLQNYPRRILNSVFASVPLQPLKGSLEVVDVSPSALSVLLPSNLKFSKEEIVKDEKFVNVFAGNDSLDRKDGILGWGHRYWGTQFGNYAGQLGDGAAALIGQGNGYEINLKGSGPTPFSRGFDGRKVLRSSIREYLCSEAMAGLNIPTTRAGSIITSRSDTIARDPDYSGKSIREQCTVVGRIAKTFFRFGSFECSQDEEKESVRSNLNFCWEHLIKPLGNENANSFIQIVTDRTAFTVAKWQAVGFTHGVLNSDNMSVIGDTLDYGPFGFIETFDPHFVPNTSDKFGRYAFSQQPRIAAWNCMRLEECILQLTENFSPKERFDKFGVVDDEKGFLNDDISSFFHQRFSLYYKECMREKLGLEKCKVSDSDFDQILDQFLELLDLSACDYTVVFRALSDLSPHNIIETREMIMQTFPSEERVFILTSVGLKVNRQQLDEIDQFAMTRLPELQRVGIDLETLKRWRHKLDRMERFKETNFRIQISQKWEEFLKRIAPLLSVTSRTTMNLVNPIYIPRQHVLQSAISKAESGDYSEVETQRRLFLNPFVRSEKMHKHEAPDLNYYGVCLSCSS